uniref:Uncharacterized protein n=1 Tax=Knipowitschia caucasica TaxID=637954 RepID=A0AAV2IV17_KNICA
MSQRPEVPSPRETEPPTLNGTSHSEPRRSWRPCQMLNQDGEVVHIHQHPHPAPHHRSRRRPHHQQTAPVHRPDSTGPNPSPHPRPAVSRYRRQGDPNPRLRAGQRQPTREESRAEAHRSPQDQNKTDQSQKSLSLHTPGGDCFPTPQVDRDSSALRRPTEEDSILHTKDVQLRKTNPRKQAALQEIEPSHDKSTNEAKSSELDVEEEPSGDHIQPIEAQAQGEGLEADEEKTTVQGEGLVGQMEQQSEDLEEFRDSLKEQIEDEKNELLGTRGEELCAEGEELDAEGEELPAEGEELYPEGEELPAEGKELRAQSEGSIIQRDVGDEAAAQESEITDLCSDTESAASLSLDGPLHSPPPMHSPTPPSSPDIPRFPQIDHFSEHASPTHTRHALPGDSDQSDTHPDDEEEESSLVSYPQTYADFYSQSHHRSQPQTKPQSEPRQHPNCFPEPLRTSYPAQPPKPQPIRNLPPLDSSIGSRLHHYDGQSDGESSERSPVSRARRKAPGRRGQAGNKQTGMSPGDERSPAETGPRGDAISLAIRGIKEAIEEVKTRAVRSPYTPDQPVEPVWVMRQESSPTEEPSGVGQTSPGSPCDSLSPPSPQDPVSPVRAEASSTFQREAPRQSSRPPNPQQRGPPAPTPPTIQEIRHSLPTFPTFVDVPGPCDPDDLIDGIIFAATYLGCTHLLSERTPSKSARMQQAQEAMNRVRAAQKQAKNRKKGSDGEALSTVEVDLFMSIQRIKVLNADTQESLMDLPLRTISYIADIGNMVVLMARGKMVRSRSAQDPGEERSHSPDQNRVYKMICHVFESEDAQLIAQSIGQSFSVAYQEFLRANGIDPEDLSQREYSDLLSTQDMYNDDLIHFSKSENCRDVYIEKQKGDILGVVIVESGWGSILPTVIIASLMHSGPAERSGRLNIGDQIMTVNGTSLVGLPLSTCQSIIKGLKSLCRIKMNIVRCPPVTMVLIRRPDLRYQLGFSVQNGIICSLMRGGIAERGGVRVGHRIIEINSQSVVATPHEKIVQILSSAMGEIHMKTMPAAMYRLLTAQEQPVYI